MVVEAGDYGSRWDLVNSGDHGADWGALWWNGEFKWMNGPPGDSGDTALDGTALDSGETAALNGVTLSSSEITALERIPLDF